MERYQGKERIGRGGLFFLTHPGEDLFSGYGLATHEGRPDRLVGLLIVDRPHPVDPAWLVEVEQCYGDCQLTPMTDKGERGLVCQMRIEPGSLAHLQPFGHSQARELQTALAPLLETPPAPILKLAWNEDERLWVSTFWIGLPPQLQEVFDRTGPGCLAVERPDLVAFVTHAPSVEIESFRGAPVEYRWELIQMSTAPLIRFRAMVYDNPDHPYVVEHFVNVGAPDQARALSRLVRQEQIAFDFFGDEYEYQYSKHLDHPERMRKDLNALAARAIEYYGTIPEEKRDFDQAKAAFQQSGVI